MKTQHSKQQRKNKAWRVAYWPDVQRIDSVPVLRSISHAWANEYLDELSIPAIKTLKFLAALNRTGTCGYLGVAVAYQLLAPKIESATEIKFSVRSLERGVAELKEAGLIDVRPWVRQSQYFRAGKRDVEMSGAGTVTLKDGRVVVRRLAIITLTDRALSFWEAPRCGHKTHTVDKKLSPAKMADRSPKPEKIDKSIILTLGTQSDLVNVSTQGRPTRPSLPPSTSGQGEVRTVEHKASTRDLKFKPGPSAPLRISQPIKNGPSPSPKSTPSASKGCTKTRPNFYRGPQLSGSRVVAQTIILAGLWDVLQKHSSRDADTCYTRAKCEMEGGLPQGWPTVVDWDYWLERWPKMSPTERDIKIMREILPLLKNRQAVTPNDQKVSFVDVSTPPSHQVGKTVLTDSWLIGVAGRIGVRDRFL